MKHTLLKRMSNQCCLVGHGLHNGKPWKANEGQSGLKHKFNNIIVRVPIPMAVETWLIHREGPIKGFPSPLTFLQHAAWQITVYWQNMYLYLGNKHLDDIAF